MTYHIVIIYIYANDNQIHVFYKSISGSREQLLIGAGFFSNRTDLTTVPYQGTLLSRWFSLMKLEEGNTWEHGKNRFGSRCFGCWNRFHDSIVFGHYLLNKARLQDSIHLILPRNIARLVDRIKALFGRCSSPTGSAREATWVPILDLSEGD